MLHVLHKNNLKTVDSSHVKVMTIGFFLLSKFSIVTIITFIVTNFLRKRGSLAFLTPISSTD